MIITDDNTENRKFRLILQDDSSNLYYSFIEVEFINKVTQFFKDNKNMSKIKLLIKKLGKIKYHDYENLNITIDHGFECKMEFISNITQGWSMCIMEDYDKGLYYHIFNDFSISEWEKIFNLLKKTNSKFKICSQCWGKIEKNSKKRDFDGKFVCQNCYEQLIIDSGDWGEFILSDVVSYLDKKYDGNLKKYKDDSIEVQCPDPFCSRISLFFKKDKSGEFHCYGCDQHLCFTNKKGKIDVKKIEDEN